VLEVTAFERPADFAAHFKARYGPTIVTQGNARKNGREADFEEAFERYFADCDRGTAGDARFDVEYLLTVGTRT
jgi:hypothetical protein